MPNVSLLCKFAFNNKVQYIFEINRNWKYHSNLFTYRLNYQSNVNKNIVFTCVIVKFPKSYLNLKIRNWWDLSGLTCSSLILKKFIVGKC